MFGHAKPNDIDADQLQVRFLSKMKMAPMTPEVLLHIILWTIFDLEPALNEISTTNRAYHSSKYYRAKDITNYGFIIAILI